MVLNKTARQSRDVGQKKMKSRYIIILWMLISLVFLDWSAHCVNGVRVGTGANFFTAYGWPNAWLIKDEYTTYRSDGPMPMHIDQHWVRWSIKDARAIIVAMVIGIGGPGVIFIPIMWISSKRKPIGQPSDAPAS